jgi:phage baseplate assembly protein W
MPRRKKTPSEQLREFHADVDRTIDGRAADVSDRVVADVSDDIHRFGARMRRRGVRNLTAQTQGGLLLTVTNRIQQAAGVIADEMGAVVREAIADAELRMARMFKSMDGEIPEALNAGISTRDRRARRTELMSQIARQDFGAGWSPNVQAAVQTALNDARAGGYSVELTVHEVEVAVRSVRWQIRMAAETHAAAAYNGAQDDTIREVARQLPDIRKRWTELIDDSTGRPYDDRVATDSFVLHGQVALPDRMFVMPADDRIPAKLHGKTWPHPPNRPHDRAVLTPWRPGWGIPGWELSLGSRRQIR